MQELANEMIKHKLDIIALQEIRWQGQGRIDKKNYSLIYSGPETRTGQLGTGFIINKSVRGSIMEYNYTNDRICGIRLKGKFRNISIISVHAPTEEKSDEDKEIFYDGLDQLLSQIPRYDIKLIMGDFNAQIGRHEDQAEVAGKYSLHKENSKNGDYLTDFAAQNKLFIRSTSFQHKTIHLGTWKIPGRDEVNQIDHVLVSKRHYSSIMDVRACRGPNIDSDHYLVKVVMRERVAVLQNIKRTRQIKWNTSSLKNDDNLLHQYQEKLKEKLEREHATTINEKWEHIRDSILEAAKETVGEIGNERNREWFDQECEEIIYKKNLTRRAMLARNTRRNCEAYKESRKEAKRILKKKKKDSMTDKIKEIEHLNREGEQRKFYQAIKKTQKEFQPRVRGCRNDDGTVEMDESKVIEKWKTHFEILLNQDCENETVQNTTIANVNQRLEDVPRIDEVRNAIKRMRNNRAPGEDDVVAELIKYGGYAVENTIHDIIKEVWENETMPDSWNVGVICPIHKKGDKEKCQNYRGISLLSSTYKILSVIILGRLKPYVDEIVDDSQTGFMSNRSTTDQIFAIRQILEKRMEYGKETHILFIDFKKAFDSLERQAILNAMIELGIPKKLTNLVSMCMEETHNKVRTQSGESETFKTETGVKQGDGLSPVVFILTLHAALKKCITPETETLGINQFQLLAYADDIAIMGENREEIERCMIVLERETNKVGLEINKEKTEYMIVGRNASQTTTVNVNGNNYKMVNSFKYLGTQLNSHNNIEEEIKIRIVNANRSFFALHNLFKSKISSRKSKMKIYKAVIIPVLTYGCETWPLTKQTEYKLQTFENKVLRKIFGPIRDLDSGTWKIRKNRDIWTLYNAPLITEVVKEHIMRWAGHVSRAEENSIIKKTLHLTYDTPRRRGRPKKRWRDGVEKLFQELKPQDTTGTWEQFAQDRRRWRELIHGGLGPSRPVRTQQ
uniref:Craniofacial development protein 2 n=1 Tax=Cacopsylla melanoneura TaxID=428564 RepID=A0A8D9EGY4_9HEMI